MYCVSAVLCERIQALAGKRYESIAVYIKATKERNGCVTMPALGDVFWCPAETF